MDSHYLEKVRAGDLDAFRYFVGKYQDRAYAIAMGMVHNRPEAEEVVQNAFLRAYQGLEKFRGDAQFGTWLHRIVVNEALRLVQKRKAQTPELTAAQPEEVSIPDLNDAMHQLEQKERQQLVRHTLSLLKPKEALVLQLFYLQELSLQEIEAHTGFTIAQIKVLLHRGRKNFYDQFQKNYQKETLL
ncbi:MAG: sigma-70 family RNA polymerase sigma factor [Lewinellaceae bacterium]|nr:sigma-70 family RNA polymerase sigma factor [Lewinellaceae bacterium]